VNKFRLTYDAAEVDDPILADTILSTKTPISILSADVDAERGSIIISVPGGKSAEKKVIGALKKKGVTVEKLEKKLEKDDCKCIDCGACTGVCPVDALSLVDWELVINQDKCIYCDACTSACPTRALNIKE